MSYASQQHVPLWSPELYALGVPLYGLCKSFSSGRLTTVGGLVGVAGPQSGCLPFVEVAGYWWVGPGPRVVAGSRDLKAAILLVGETVSLPS